MGWVMAGCGGSPGVDGETLGGSGEGDESGSDDGDGQTSGGEIPIDEPPPLECADAPVAIDDARFVTTVEISSAIESAVASPHGGADVVIDDEVQRFDGAGQWRSTLELAPDLHPVALGVDGQGLLYVASSRDVDLGGEIDLVLQRYTIDDVLLDELELDLVPYGNERPEGISVSPAGWVALHVRASYDGLAPGLADVFRVARIDPSLALVDDLDLDPAPVRAFVDDQGTVYPVAELPGEVGVASFPVDGSTGWSTTLPHGSARITAALGPDELWIAQEDYSSPGGGRLDGLARADGAALGSAVWSPDFLDELIDKPKGVAALPCGGAVLYSQIDYQGDRFAAFSVMRDGEKGEPTVLFEEPPLAGTEIYEMYGVSIATNGRGLATARILSESVDALVLMGF